MTCIWELTAVRLGVKSYAAFAQDTVCVRIVSIGEHCTATMGGHITVSAQMDRIASHWVSCPKV